MSGNPYDPANKAVAEMSREALIHGLSRELEGVKQDLEQEKARCRRWTRLFGEAELEHQDAVGALRQELREATEARDQAVVLQRSAELARDRILEDVEERLSTARRDRSAAEEAATAWANRFNRLNGNLIGDEWREWIVDQYVPASSSAVSNHLRAALRSALKAYAEKMKEIA